MSIKIQQNVHTVDGIEEVDDYEYTVEVGEHIFELTKEELVELSNELLKVIGTIK